MSATVETRRLRLLFVVTEDWYFVSHRLALAEAARAAGYAVSVATRDGAYADRIRAAGIELIPLRLSRRGGAPLREIVELTRLYRALKPDLVHHVALKSVVYGSVAALFAGVPGRVNAIAGLGWLFTSARGGARLLRRPLRVVLAWLLRRPGSLALVQNADDLAFLAGAGVLAGRLRLVPGAGVDTRRFAPAAVPPQGPVRVVLAARMLRDKGVAEFVEAASLLNTRGVRAQFVLVGAPDPDNPASLTEAELRAMTRQGVEWPGQCADMPEVWRGAHIACLPSYREGLPKSLLEAAACGLPIVTSDTPGCRDTVSAGNGLLVPPRDPERLAEALMRLITDPALRADMGHRSRVLAVERFDQSHIHAATLALYRELLG